MPARLAFKQLCRFSPLTEPTAPAKKSSAAGLIPGPTQQRLAEVTRGHGVASVGGARRWLASPLLGSCSQESLTQSVYGQGLVPPPVLPGLLLAQQQQRLATSPPRPGTAVAVLARFGRRRNHHQGEQQHEQRPRHGRAAGRMWAGARVVATARGCRGRRAPPPAESRWEGAALLRCSPPRTPLRYWGLPRMPSLDCWGRRGVTACCRYADGSIAPHRAACKRAQHFWPIRPLQR